MVLTRRWCKKKKQLKIVFHAPMQYDYNIALPSLFDIFIYVLISLVTDSTDF